MSYKSIVGEENYSTHKADLLAYSIDSSRMFGRATAVLWPASALQVHRIILEANRNRDNLVFRGAGTGLAGAAVPQNSIVVDLSRMNRILTINKTEMYAIVEPGVILDNLNHALRKIELLFPVLPASHSVCTIGGMIATNAAGQRALRFGRVREWIKSLKVIDGTGKYYEVGNESDFIGTEGVLGVVVEATLNLTTPLKAVSMDYEVFGSSAEMLELVKKRLALKDVISMEFFDPVSSSLIGLEQKYMLITEYETERGKINSPHKIKQVRKKREPLGPYLTSMGYTIMEDPYVPLDKIDELLDWLYSNNVPVFGHIGIGVIHPRFKHDQKDLIHEMFGLVKRLGGDVSGEHGIGLAKKNYVDPSRIEHLTMLKNKYDPNNVLNRGKLI